MANELPQRLAAILAADIADYTRLMELDEAGVVDAWRRAREQVIDPTVVRYRGRIVKLTGDGFLAEFSTAESAVKAALEMQTAFAALFGDLPIERRVAFRMGVNIGDIWVDAEDIYGAGVNIAARLEGLAERGGLCISGAVYDAVKHKIAARYESMGPQTVKHVSEPILVWRARSVPAAGVHDPQATHQRSSTAGREGVALATLGRAIRGPWQSVGVLVVAAMIGTFVTLSWNTLRQPQTLRMAVLPFRNGSADSAQEYLSDGITDEMISELGQLHPERLSVIARTSVMRYKKSTQSASEIGRELRVDYVLEGSVLREGDTIRVIPTLIETRNDTRVWGQPYERRLSGALALQRAMARDIAESLKFALLPEEKARLASARELDPEAYEDYLQGRLHFDRVTPQDMNLALEFFDRSLERSPDSALAYAWISLVHTGRSQLGAVPTREAHAAAKPAAEKALQLDPDLPEAHFAAAVMHTWQEWDWSAADHEFQKAIALNRSYADARAAYSHYLTIVGRPKEGIEQIEQAIVLDPFNPLHQSFYATFLAIAGRCDKAMTTARGVLQVVPTNPVAVTALAACLFELGRRDEELAVWRGQFTGLGDQDRVRALDDGFAADGYRGAMRGIAALMDARAQSGYVASVEVAEFHARAGDSERALAWLERALEARDQNLPYIGVVPTLASLRNEQRFLELLRQMNLAPK